MTRTGASRPLVKRQVLSREHTATQHIVHNSTNPWENPNRIEINFLPFCLTKAYGVGPVAAPGAQGPHAARHRQFALPANRRKLFRQK